MSKDKAPKLKKSTGYRIISPTMQGTPTVFQSLKQVEEYISKNIIFYRGRVDVVEVSRYTMEPTDDDGQDDELRAEISQYLESTYQDGAVMATRPNSGYHKRVDEFTDKILELIRTEKLKLLAESREQTTIFKIKAHDKKGQPHLYEAGRGVPPEVLDKLEAEL